MKIIEDEIVEIIARFMESYDKVEDLQILEECFQFVIGDDDTNDIFDKATWILNHRSFYGG